MLPYVKLLASSGCAVGRQCEPMSEQRDLRSKADVLEVLRRTGVDRETIQAVDAALPDPVDVQRDAAVLARYGVTRDLLVDRMGGSP